MFPLLKVDQHFVRLLVVLQTPLVDHVRKNLADAQMFQKQFLHALVSINQVVLRPIVLSTLIKS